MKGLKGFFKKFEDAMVAVAFAEAGEFETAKEILKTSEEMVNGKGEIGNSKKNTNVITTTLNS